VGYLVVFAGQALLTQAGFTRTSPGGNDFYPTYAAGCAWLLRGENPYSPELTLAIQKVIYGRPALPGEDHFAFVYPIYTVVFVWPLCAVRDFSLVQALWMTLLTHLILLETILAWRLSRWRPPRWLWPWILIWAVLVYPNARAILLGQLAVIVGALILLSLEALRRHRDGVAGILLALATIKPQMILLVVPWLLLWSVARRRWGVLASFSGGLAVLILLPLAFLPTWPLDFLTQLGVYSSYTELHSVTWILTSYYLHLPGIVDGSLTLAALVWMACEWWRARREALPAMLWATSLSLVLTPFVAPRTATTSFSPLVLPLFMAFALQDHATNRQGSPWIAAAVMAGVFVGGWWLFLATVRGIQESALMYLPIPVALLAALPWMRSSWLRTSRAVA
jgi:hypothetical protein